MTTYRLRTRSVAQRTQPSIYRSKFSVPLGVEAQGSPLIARRPGA